MKKIMMGLLCVALTSFCMAEDLVDYSGVWQDELSGAYYTINQKDDKLVLVALPFIQRGDAVLESAYIGTAAAPHGGSDAGHRLDRVQPVDPPNILNRLVILYVSPTSLIVFPDCPVCSVPGANLRKVF